MSQTDHPTDPTGPTGSYMDVSPAINTRKTFGKGRQRQIKACKGKTPQRIGERIQQRYGKTLQCTGKMALQ